MKHILEQEEYNELKKLAEREADTKYMDIYINIRNPLNTGYDHGMYDPIEYFARVSDDTCKDLDKICLDVNKQLVLICNDISKTILNEKNKLDKARKKLSKMCWLTGILNIILLILILWKHLS